MSSRTVQRRPHELMARFGAQTRVQATLRGKPLRGGQTSNKQVS
jgi:hypothetical protein